MKPRTLGLVGVLAAAWLAKAQGAKGPYPSMAPPDQYLMERNAEITLARSAAPQSISQEAEIMVLGQQRYQTAVNEVPLASWRVHATAFELNQNSGDRDLAERHLALSRETIMKLANSMSRDEPLRQTYLSAPAVRKILSNNIEKSEVLKSEVTCRTMPQHWPIGPYRVRDRPLRTKPDVFTIRCTAQLCLDGLSLKDQPRVEDRVGTSLAPAKWKTSCNRNFKAAESSGTLQWRNVRAVMQLGILFKALSRKAQTTIEKLVQQAQQFHLAVNFDRAMHGTLTLQEFPEMLLD
jgi:hypothetical protein